MLLAFSLLSNSRRLLSLTQSPDDIHSVHGIRALNAFMLLMSHKSMMLFYNPYINRTAMVEVWYALSMPVQILLTFLKSLSTLYND